MITEDYVPYEIAKLLKEKGFDGECFAAYNGNGKLYEFDEEVDDNTPYWSDAPTLQMAMKWLREAHNIIISIFPTIETDMIVREDYSYAIYKNKISVYQNCSITYEQACEAAIKHCLENLI